MRVPSWYVTAITYSIRWIPEAVANLMHANGIRSRGELANILGLSRDTIYRAFDQQWAGTATATVLGQIAGVFNVPMHQLVVEPATANRRQSRTKTVRKSDTRA